jgi:hypothetical protein
VGINSYATTNEEHKKLRAQCETRATHRHCSQVLYTKQDKDASRTRWDKERKAGPEPTCHALDGQITPHTYAHTLFTRPLYVAVSSDPLEYRLCLHRLQIAPWFFLVKVVFTVSAVVILTVL